MIFFGPDADGDGVLSPRETAHRRYVCRDAKDKTGQKLLLFKQLRVAPGAICAAGGVQLVWGYDRDGDGSLMGEVKGSLILCNGRDGRDGRNGLSSLIRMAAASTDPDNPCAADGQKISTGPDDNANGSLEPEEVDEVSFVCNGMSAAPIQALITTKPEPPGVNCAIGGTRIDSGLDTNGNGVLDDAERTSSSYVCAAPACNTSNWRVFSPELIGCFLSGAALDGLDLRNADFTKADLRNATLDGTVLAFAVLRRADLSGASLQQAILVGANLQGASLRSVNATGANFQLADVSDADVRGADFSDANLFETRFTRSDLSGATLANVDLTGANLDSAVLAGTQFININAYGVNLRQANLNGARFDGGRLWVSDLSGADLTAADLGTVRLNDVRAVQLQGCPVTLPPQWFCIAAPDGFVLVGPEANLRDARLSELTLAGYNLSRSRLLNTDLSGANLSGTDLSYAAFDNTALLDANLENTDLRYAQIVWTRFAGVRLAGADMTHAHLSLVNTVGVASCPALLPNARWRCSPTQNGLTLFGPGLRLIGPHPDVLSFAGDDLSGVDLSGSIFHDVSFSGASLRGATLASVELRRVDLSFADLSGANLADLRWTGLGPDEFPYSANLTGVVTDPATICPDGASGPCTW